MFMYVYVLRRAHVKKTVKKRYEIQDYVVCCCVGSARWPVVQVNRPEKWPALVPMVRGLRRRSAAICSARSLSNPVRCPPARNRSAGMLERGDWWAGLGTTNKNIAGTMMCSYCGWMWSVMSSFHWWWFLPFFLQCSRSCGSGSRERQVICSDQERNLYPVDQCSSHPKPSTVERCNTQSCNSPQGVHMHNVLLCSTFTYTE